MAVSTKRKPANDSQVSQIPNKRQKNLPYTANTSIKRHHHASDSSSVPPATITETTTTTTLTPILAAAATTDDKNMAAQLNRIAHSTKTPFQKRVLSLLCQVPRGRVTTYGLMSKHLGSSPRAIGNAMRRNPFAPAVPCHRVVATGGGLGGFKGQWPKDGEGITLDEKRVLLRGEGVRFDGGGKVVGTPFCGFV